MPLILTIWLLRLKTWFRGSKRRENDNVSEFFDRSPS